MNKKVNALLIDDEPKCVEILSHYLGEYCPEISVIGSAGTVSESIKMINHLNPEIIFVDISLPDGDGFKILDSVDNKNFKAVFITAYHEYAIKAFKYSAFDYLLKPLNPEELRNTVDRVLVKQQVDVSQQISVYQNVLKKNCDKILLPTANELVMVCLSNVIRCEAEGNYTNFHLNNGGKIMICKSLNTIEVLLGTTNFCRVHKKHFVNLEYFKKYKRGRGGVIVLSDDSHVDVSENKKQEFMDKLKEYAQVI